MAGESTTGRLPASGAGCLAMLRNMERDEILEILSEGLCQHCDVALQQRVQTLTQNSSNLVSPEKNIKSSNATWASARTPESVFSGTHGGYATNPSLFVNSKQSAFKPSDYEISLNDGLSRTSSAASGGMSEEQKEFIRFQHVSRKKDFSYYERINGKSTNVLKGLELHSRVFNTEEQRHIVECVYDLQRMGQKGQLRARTYSEPRKWMRGKGRVTLQFGCCYNYAMDKDGNPPGIIRDEEVDPLPPVFKKMIKRIVKWHVLPASCIPNSCIVNIYEEGDCIPPHIDHHDFVRPFCTVSFLTECSILFGSSLKILSPGEFDGPVSIPLPIGSVLILNGNGADVAKHCVPGVPSKRISITFRKMDDSKLPYHYAHDPELLGIKPLNYSGSTKSLAPIECGENKKLKHEESHVAEKTTDKALFNGRDDFPPLGRINSRNNQRINANGSGSGIPFSKRHSYSRDYY